MSKNLDHEILKLVAKEPGISKSSVIKRLKNIASRDTIIKHIYKLCAENYIKLNLDTVLEPLKKCKEAVKGFGEDENE